MENDQTNIKEFNILDWDKNEKIKKEFESIGFFVGEHPLKSNLQVLKKYNVSSHQELKIIMLLKMQ